MQNPENTGLRTSSKLLCGELNGKYKLFHTKGSQTMANMIRFLCLPAEGQARRTLRAIGLAFVLGCTTTHAGSSLPPLLTTYEQLVLKEIVDSLILFPSPSSGTTTNPFLKSPSPTDPLYKESPRPNRNGIEVNNTTEHGSTSCALLITSTTLMMVYSLPFDSKTQESPGCSRLSLRPLNQKNLSSTLMRER